jgi:hypothetical protein
MFALAAALAGCGPSEIPYTDNSQDPAAYARDIKAQINSAVRNARSSNEPVDHLEPLLLELKRSDRPLGESRSVYEDLRARVEQLVADCKRQGRGAPNLSGRLDELLKVAKTLPGETSTAEN